MEYFASEDELGLGLQISFSIIVATLVINIALICHIKFSDQSITHMTMRPYFFALALLLVLTLEASIWLYLFEVEYKDQLVKLFLDIVIYKKTLLYSFTIIFAALKSVGLMIFTLTRVHENEALLAFIIF